MRADYSEVPKTNKLYERYYDQLGLVEVAEREEFWKALRRELPNSFRFTGSKGYPCCVSDRFQQVTDCMFFADKLSRYSKS